MRAVSGPLPRDRARKYCNTDRKDGDNQTTTTACVCACLRASFLSTAVSSETVAYVIPSHEMVKPLLIFRRKRMTSLLATRNAHAIAHVTLYRGDDCVNTQLAAACATGLFFWFVWYSRRQPVQHSAGGSLFCSRPARGCDALELGRVCFLFLQFLRQPGGQYGQRLRRRVALSTACRSPCLQTLQCWRRTWRLWRQTLQRCNQVSRAASHHCRGRGGAANRCCWNRGAYDGVGEPSGRQQGLLNKTASSHSVSLDDLSTVTNAAAAWLSTVEADVKSALEDLSTLQADAATAETRVSLLQAGAAVTEAGVASLELAMTAAEEDVTALQTDVAGAEANVLLLQETVSLVETDMLAAEARELLLAANVTTVQTNVAALQADVAALHTDLVGFDSDVASVLEDVAELQTDLTTAETNVLLLQAGATWPRSRTSRTNLRATSWGCRPMRLLSRRV